MGASTSTEIPRSDDPIVAADETTSPFLPATGEDAPEDLVQTYDDPLICCCCDGGFDTDLSLADSETHRLPITCRECFNCSCCFQCLKKCSNEANKSVPEEEATTEVTCPDCMKVGFDVKKVYPDRNLCYLLLTVRKFVEERKAVAGLGVEESLAKPKYRVGQKLKKKFGGKWFLGDITDFRQVTVYSVQYEDGDSEEMEENCLRDDNIVFLEGCNGEKRQTPKKRPANRVVTKPSFHNTRSKKEVGTKKLAKKRPITNLGCHEDDHKKKKSKKSRKTAGNEAGVIDASAWLDEFDRLFPSEDSSFPESFDEVVRVMDILLSEKEGVYFEDTFNSGTNRYHIKRIIFKLEEKEDPRLAWHEPCSPWGPPTKESLKEFILLLLNITRSDKRINCIRRVSPGGNSTKSQPKPNTTKNSKKTRKDTRTGEGKKDESWLNQFDRLFPYENSGLPKNFTEVVRAMNTLLSEKEGIDFKKVLNTGTNRSHVSTILLTLEEKKDPRVIWHEPYTPWGPPTKEALKEFILLLLGIARNGEKLRAGPGVGFVVDGGIGDKEVSWQEKLRTIKKLPKTLREVLKLMDKLLGDEEQYNVTQDVNRTLCTLRRSTENYPDHPGLAWHTPGKSWCPPDIDSLESFIELLLGFSRRRRRDETMSLDQPKDDSSDDDNETDGGSGDKEVTWQEKLRTIDVLPKSLPQVLKLMDDLLGDEERCTFTQDTKRTTNVLYKSTETVPDHPGLAWRTPGESWCPPDVESLESFIELLLGFSRRRRRGERMSLATRRGWKRRRK